MANHCGFLRFTHTRQFIIGFVGAIVMQIINHPFRVDVGTLNLKLHRTIWNRADVADIPARSR
ncbi:hypothetical protein D3C75_1374800 [compost metagenome]